MLFQYMCKGGNCCYFHIFPILCCRFAVHTVAYMCLFRMVLYHRGQNYIYFDNTLCFSIRMPVMYDGNRYKSTKSLTEWMVSKRMSASCTSIIKYADALFLN